MLEKPTVEEAMGVHESRGDQLVAKVNDLGITLNQLSPVALANRENPVPLDRDVPRVRDARIGVEDCA